MRRVLFVCALLLALSACNNSSPVERKPDPLIAYPAERNGRWDFHIVDPNTGQDRIITQGIDNVLPYFDWSPDGSRIVLTAGPNEYDNELFLVDVHSGAITQLTDNKVMDANPDWSPDGKWIAFHSGIDADGRSTIWLINPDSREREVLSEMNALSNAAWSPDMTMICGSGYIHINPPTTVFAIIDVQSKRVAHEIVSEGGVVQGKASWSPDSTRIAYTTNQDGNYNIYIASAVDVEQEPVQVTQLQGQEVGTLWSPDGKEILFTHYLENESQAYDIQVYTVDVETFELHPFNTQETMAGMDWSPDSQKIVTVVNRGDTDFVGIINRDGSNLKILDETGSETIWPPKWNPASK